VESGPCLITSEYCPAAIELISELFTKLNCLRPVTGTLAHEYTINNRATIDILLLIMANLIYSPKDITVDHKKNEKSNQLCHSGF
jgi:hypothetical protein